MIAELVIDSIASGAITVGLFFAGQRFKKYRVKPDALGAYPWLWRNSSSNGFFCPKCINIHLNNKQPKYCTCEEYHTDHYHFTCADCGFTTLMRTADSK